MKSEHSKLLSFLAIAVLLAYLMPSAVHAAKKPEGTIIGPTGIRGEYLPKWPKTATAIHVTDVEGGSPASGTGLKVGDIIVGLWEQKFEKHPLWGVADAIEKAEGSDGKLTLLLKTGKQVDIKLDPIGAYSATAPYDCPKTEKIIKQAAERLLAQGLGGTATQTDMLGVLATGEKEYIEAVSKSIHDGDILDLDLKMIDDYYSGRTNISGSTGWTWGYSLIALGEYYLLTKDESVLPAMHAYALGLARGQDPVGCWGHRMATGPKNRTPGYGTMNQPSLSNLIGMMIAQKCGIKDPVVDKAVETSYATFENVVGRGGFAYGSGGNYPDFFNNNGTSGSAAICMSLKGNQKGAEYFSQIAATSYDSLTSGHASSFFNPLWTPVGASFSGPEVTQQFFKKSLWYFTPQRHWQGGFPQKDKTGAVGGQALLMYCIPRRALLITGREADESIFVKGDEVNKVIGRSKIDYKNRSTDDLMELIHDPFIQVRLRAQRELASRAGNGKKADTITPKVLAVMKDGSQQEKLNALSYLEACHRDVQKIYTDWLGKIVRDKNELLKVRVAAATVLGGRPFGKDALPYYNDILKLVFEDRVEPDPFARIDNDLSAALDGISRNSGTKPLDEEVKVDKELLYKVANRFLDHKRQKVRQVGCALIVGIPKEDFPIIAEKLIYVLYDEAPDYHTYSNVVNVPGITILAEMNVQEGLDLLVDAIFNRGGKWGFKYRSLMQALPHYGANAEPYIEKFEAHKDINKPGDRFTPQWQKVVKEIREDKNPPKLMTIEEVLEQDERE